VPAQKKDLPPVTLVMMDLEAYPTSSAMLTTSSPVFTFLTLNSYANNSNLGLPQLVASSTHQKHASSPPAMDC
jgi:hypothetical protein